MYSKNYNNWVRQANLPPLTSKQHKFAEFLFDHYKMVGQIGDMSTIFESVRKYIKTHDIEESNQELER